METTYRGIATRKKNNMFNADEISVLLESGLFKWELESLAVKVASYLVR